MDGENNNNIEAAIEAGKKIGEIKKIQEDGDSTFYLVHEDFKIQKVDNNNLQPDRKKGFTDFTSTASFCYYVNKHKINDQTVIVADDNGLVRSTFNDHGKEPQWGDFGANLRLSFSRQWLKWNQASGNLFSQLEFSEFIEDNRPDFMCGKIVDGEGKEVENIRPLELSKMILDLQSTTEENFSSKIDPVSGRTNLSFSNEEVGKQVIKLPKQFVLALPVYKNGDLFQVSARLRTRIGGGTAKFGFILDQKDEIVEKAFDKICNRIKVGDQTNTKDPEKNFDGTNIEVLRGPVQ